MNNGIPPKDYRPHGNGNAQSQADMLENQRLLPEAQANVDRDNPILAGNLKQVVHVLKSLELQVKTKKLSVLKLSKLQSQTEQAAKVAQWLTAVKNDLVAKELMALKQKPKSGLIVAK